MIRSFIKTFFALLLISSLATVVGQKVELTFWSMLTQPERVEIVEELISRFETENPNVTIELVTMPWGGALDRIVAAILANSPPDVSIVGQGWPQTLAGTGGILPLDDVIEDVGGEDMFVGTSLNVLSALDGTIWAAPIYVTPNGIFYRKSWLEEAGISEPPTNWEEFAEAVSAIADPASGRFGYTTAFDLHGGKEIWGWLLANDVMLLDRDAEGNWQVSVGERAVETFQYLADLLQTSAPPGAASYAQKDLQSLFAAGRMGFYYGSPEILDIIIRDNPAILDDVGFIPVPAQVRSGSSQGYVSLVVYDTPRAETAKEFVRFFFEQENLLDFTLSFANTHFPPYRPVLEDPRYVEGLPAHLVQVAEQAETVLDSAAGIAQEVGAHPWAGEIEARQLLPRTLARILVDNWSAERAVDELRAELQQLIQ